MGRTVAAAIALAGSFAAATATGAPSSGPAFDRALALSLHVPMTLRELRGRIGRESDQDGRRHFWHSPRGGNLTAEEIFDHPGVIGLITGSWGKDYWIIDKDDVHCAPDHTVSECQMGFPSLEAGDKAAH